MRLSNQIIAASCTGWISVLGAGVYFAGGADSYSRAGVIREGVAVGTAGPGAQDAQSRPVTGEPTPGESAGANPRSPGFQPFVVSAYSHGCILPKWGPEPPPQPMASGEWPVAGLHVAGPPEMAFGTVLEVVYKGLPSRLIVGDRGRAIVGRRLDLFLATCRAARAWGRRTAYVREVSE